MYKRQTALLHRVQEMKFFDVVDGNELPNIAKYWVTISSRSSYKEGILDYQTGEWAPVLEGLYGNGPNDHNDFLWDKIKTYKYKKEE